MKAVNPFYTREFVTDGKHYRIIVLHAAPYTYTLNMHGAFIIAVG